MNVLRFPVAIFTILFVAASFLAAAPAFSEVLDPPDCQPPCTAQYRACSGAAKDSPNDIDRELCENDRKACFASCDAQLAEFQRQVIEKERQEKEEKALLGIEDKRTAQERDEDFEAQLDREAQEKQERLDKAAREEQERQEKAAQEKLENETLNGNIKIFQFE